jgi:transposase-like protein
MTDTTTVLKTDVLGRVKVSREHREALLDAFETSGLSGVAFARHHGVTYPTFATWMQKRRRERGLYPVAQPGGGQVVYGGQCSTCCVKTHLKFGA